MPADDSAKSLSVVTDHWKNHNTTVFCLIHKIYKSMIPEVKKEIIELGDGRTISIETGKLAKQADGSVVVRMGNAMLLATVVSAKEINPETDFLRLAIPVQIVRAGWLR